MKAVFPAGLLALFCIGLSTGICAQIPAPKNAPSARELLVNAQIGYDSAQYPLSREYAEQAYHFFRQSPDQYPAELAGSSDLVGQAFYKQDSFLQAKTWLQKAASLWAKAYPKGSREEAKTRTTLGHAMFKLDDPDGVFDQGLKALDILDSLPEENLPERIAAFRLTGRTYFGIGLYNKAIPYYENALKCARKYYPEDNIEIAQMLVRLGFCHVYSGDQEKAMSCLETALSIQQKKLPPFSEGISSTYLALGSCAQALKKQDNALSYYEKAVEIQIKSRGNTNPLLAFSYSKIGQVSLDRHDFRKALDFFLKEKEILIYNKNEKDLPYAFACRDLGLAYIGLKENKQAIEWLEQALILFRGQNTTQNQLMSIDLCNVIFQIGRAQSADGDYEAAIKSLEENQRILKQIYLPEPPVMHESDAEIAYAYQQWYLKTKQDSLLNKSRDYFHRAESGIDRQLQNETYEDTQKKLLTEAIPVFERAIQTELLYGKNHPENPQPLEKAWKFSEAMHGYLLFSCTQEANARHFAGIPDAELRRDSQLRAEITALSKKRESLLEGQGVRIDDSLALALSLQISAKKASLAQLLAYFGKKYPDYFRLKYDLQASSLDKTQKLLSPEQTLLEYFTGDSSIFVFVVQRAGSRVLELPRDFPLAQWVQNFREGISGYHAAESALKTPALIQKTVLEYADAAQKLYGKLLAPLAGSLTPELIIVPGDGFANLPFEALLSAAPRDPGNFNTYPFLLRQYSIQYAYSATMMHQMSARRHPKPATRGLLAFAPFFESDTAGLAIRLLREGGIRLGLAPLPFSGEEVLRAQKRCGGASTVLMGPVATKQKFQELANQYKILHLATHGKANHLAGDFSFLAFASGDENLENGLLSVGELYNLSLNADLVLLSACETAIGEQQHGEGVISLARAFAFAGAKSIVASLWSVNDKSTMEVMDHFYAGIKAGKSKPTALHDAKLQYLENNPGRMSHPFFWAAFVGVGDPDVIRN